MQYLHVKNIAKYQPQYKDGRRLLWIRWDIDAMCDYKITRLTPAQKWLLIGLICLEVKNQEPIPYDEKWISDTLGMQKQSIHKDLLMLQTIELVVTGCYKQGDSMLPTDIHTIHTDIQTRHNNASLTDSDFLDSLKTNPSLTGVDVDAELGKMDVWLLAHPGRKKTRKFITNWLNKADRVVGIATNRRKAEAKKDCTACSGTGKLENGGQCWCVS